MLFFISFVASASSVLSLIPQIILLLRTKCAKDLSMGMVINLVICSVSWMTYGLLTSSSAVFLTNIFMTVSAVTLLVLKIKYTPSSTN